jgi:hypothetical protein
MSDFKWAMAPQANVKEPIEALKENGWQAGDVPTASNFNWLFYEIGYDLQQKTVLLDQVRDQLNVLTTLITEIKQRSEQITETLATVKAVGDQNAIDSGHYRRAISECLRVLNHENLGEKLGLETNLRNDYPFPPRRGVR